MKSLRLFPERSRLSIFVPLFLSLIPFSARFSTAQNVPEKIPGEAKVQEFVRALESPSAAERSAAEKSLTEMGPEILPFLPETARRPEVKMRLNRIRLALERTSAQDSLEASRMTLPKEINIRELRIQTYEKTRNRIEFQLPEETVYAPPADQAGTAATFWEFLDTFCDANHLAPQLSKEQNGLFLAKTLRTTPRSGSQNPRTAYLGPFRLEPLKITSTLLFERNTPAALLQLEIAWEPRIQPVFAYLNLKEIAYENKIVKKEGNEKEEERENTEYEPLPAGEHELLIGTHDFRALCDAALPAAKFPAGTRTISLRGTLSAVACGESRDFIFDGLAEKVGEEFTPVSQRTAAVLVTFTGLRTESVLNSAESSSKISNKKKTPKKYLVATLRYRYEEPHEAMESHRMWIYDNYAFLQASNGRKIVSERSELLRQTPNEIAADLYFPMTPETEKALSEFQLVFPRPCGIYEVEYPFEIKGITVP